MRVGTGGAGGWVSTPGVRGAYPDDVCRGPGEALAVSSWCPTLPSVFSSAPQMSIH